MDREKQIFEIESLIKDLPNDKIKDLYNSYAETSCNELIFEMGEIDDVLCGLSPREVINSLSSSFNINDDYFIDTIYGLDSFDSISDCEHIDLTQVAKYVISHEEFGYFDEDDLLEAFYETVSSDVPNRSRDDFERANEMYYDFFGVFFDITDSWDTLENDLIEIIDHDFEVD